MSIKQNKNAHYLLFSYLRQHLLTVDKKYFTVGLSFLICEMGKPMGVYMHLRSPLVQGFCGSRSVRELVGAGGSVRSIGATRGCI